ncbi:hypothetical protein JX265_010255 [Neoarthrinium moseri]|uniref:Uncharacterized protein n=1 Tax=Neoarthrinium moseri TaxID=1658444 RepID=A0A9P9WEU7_9PEZI|nr:hypothetical protein JX265_010255 [Neoarthrinium moseri]
MADLASESANRVTPPAGALKGNAPPTPPETQEVKGIATAPDQPQTASGPIKTDLPAAQPVPPASVSEPAKEAEPLAGSTNVTTGPDAVSKPSVSEPAATSETKQQLSEAEKLATQPEKLTEDVSAPLNANPINAEPITASSTVPGDDPKKSAKPVSVEEVQDPELPAAKPTTANEALKPESSTAETAKPAPAKDVEMNDAPQPAVSASQDAPNPVSKPEPAGPLPSEPQTGAKRKAAEAPTANGDVSETHEPEGPAEKKHKSFGSAVKDAIKKVGRPKKDKKAPAPVGRTARKTRSQGNADPI